MQLGVHITVPVAMNLWNLQMMIIMPIASKNLLVIHLDFYGT